MYYVGICDDDPVFINYIKRLFVEVCEDVEFFEYLSGEELVRDMEVRERFDCLILDVAMPGMDGNETARNFRKQFPNTILIFCSGVCMPTDESFKTTPYRYWLKQYTEERMNKEISEVVKKLEKSRIYPYIMAKINNQTKKLSASRISYISISRTGSVIHCGDSDEKYTSHKKPSAFYEVLKDFGFAYAHNSYIVNLKYVVIAGPKELELTNGEKLTVSRSRAKEFLEAFATELSQKYD